MADLLGGKGMRDPFLIEGPAVISFSGGRTSGYMLRRILQAHGGKLPDDVVVIFTNTGKEREETLDFVRACGAHWDVSIIWLEWKPSIETSGRFKVVDYSTAARSGEPFDALLTFAADQNWEVRLPNVANRICSFNLKAKTAEQYCKVALNWEHWDCAIGIRADEPRRLSKARTVARQDNIYPLASAGIGKRDVAAFWRQQAFDLKLPYGSDGSTVGGNCDLCFLKHIDKVIGLIREVPARADWWAKKEKQTGETFRLDRPNYIRLKEIAAIPGLFDMADESIEDCACTD